jgi:SET domain
MQGEITTRDKLNFINSMISDDNIPVDVDIFQQIFQLDECLSRMWKIHEKFIAKFLTKQVQIGTLNYHEVYGYPLKVGGLVADDVEKFQKSLAYKRGMISFGNGSFPFSSLINHSCAPNVVKTFIDDKAVLIVQRPIKANEQIFDNYGFHFTHFQKIQRQADLMKQYRFKCQCIACCEDYGLLPMLKISDKNVFRHAKKSCQELSSLNPKRARIKFKEYAELIQKSHGNFPCLETCSLIESFTACIEIILKPDIMFP